MSLGRRSGISEHDSTDRRLLAEEAIWHTFGNYGATQGASVLVALSQQVPFPEMADECLRTLHNGVVGRSRVPDQVQFVLGLTAEVLPL